MDDDKGTLGGPAAEFRTRPDEETFADALYEWMRRAPWLALSALAHAVVLLVLWAIPWDLLQSDEHTELVAELDALPEQVFNEPLPEPLDELVDATEIDEPVLRTPELPDDGTPRGDAPSAEPDLASLVEPDTAAKWMALGLGPRGALAGRARGVGGTRRGGGRGTEQALVAGLEWLAAHQSADGSWDADGFDADCGELDPGSSCTGPGQAPNDVGVTGLALLAFLGNGDTPTSGDYADVVQRGIRWLQRQQDPDTGLVGEKLGHAFVYDHAIATLALCESYYRSRNPLLRGRAQAAVDYCLAARNPYGAWRYEVPPSGENDTSVTGWMVFALKSAEEAGLTVDPDAFAGAAAWLDEVTDASSGRVGYDTPGSASSRIERRNDRFPVERGEAMTAVGLLSRIFLGQDPGDRPMLTRHADLMLRKLPEWDPEGLGVDMYYWYYGSYAMYQMGGPYWIEWQRAMEQAVVRSQRKDGDARGSWDPVGPWGFSGGRVYSTALMSLCLEVYFRYARVTGAR